MLTILSLFTSFTLLNAQFALFSCTSYGHLPFNVSLVSGIYDNITDVIWLGMNSSIYQYDYNLNTFRLEYTYNLHPFHPNKFSSQGNNMAIIGNTTNTYQITQL